jgi:hypothetical protein
MSILPVKESHYYPVQAENGLELYFLRTNVDLPTKTVNDLDVYKHLTDCTQGVLFNTWCGFDPNALRHWNNPHVDGLFHKFYLLRSRGQTMTYFTTDTMYDPYDDAPLSSNCMGLGDYHHHVIKAPPQCNAVLIVNTARHLGFGMSSSVILWAQGDKRNETQLNMSQLDPKLLNTALSFLPSSLAQIVVAFCVGFIYS